MRTTMEFDSRDDATHWSQLRTFSIGHATDIYNHRNQAAFTVAQFTEYWAKKHGETAVIAIDGRPQRVVSSDELE